MYIFRLIAFAAVLMVLLVAPNVHAQQLQDVVSPNITINLPSRTLELYSGNELVKEYPIAIGKPSTPTPMGNYSIINKEVNPVWMPPRKGYVVPSGPDNPLGYRWIGFLPLYGIHGTNAPWAIGMAVSNGCVRMNEEDVEELYELVDYGTKVAIIYERVKVRINDKGDVSLGIYPDIYGYRQVSLSEIYSKLAKTGLAGFASEQFLLNQIRTEPDKQVVFARLFKIKVDSIDLNERGVRIDDVMYVPIWPVAAVKKSNVIWDERNQIVRIEKNSAPGVIKGDVIYVTPESLAKLYAGQQQWSDEENCLEINQINLLVNGKVITNDVKTVDNILAVPVIQLANVLGHKSKWDDAKQNFTVQGQIVPIHMIDDQPYIKITKIYDIFKAYVFWNEKQHTIELTYPFKG
ncbi:L,D-transpeptidase family protein [Dendrosporobacter sp. 1207_IL3150]|uniref:L,D-transpeptidase family protein n=1 Tax=Dendrosporobacter sp. 1207_IL3150 TaxID=3084054 RepID=UPI002FDB7D96